MDLRSKDLVEFPIKRRRQYSTVLRFEDVALYSGLVLIHRYQAKLITDGVIRPHAREPFSGRKLGSDLREDLLRNLSGRGRWGPLSEASDDRAKEALVVWKMQMQGKRNHRQAEAQTRAAELTLATHA